MQTIIISACVAFAITVLLAPILINLLRKLKFGQKILEDGPTWHESKQNTPTMGGLIFISGITAAVLACLPEMLSEMDFRPLIMLSLSLIFGAIGFVDDYAKIKKQRNKGLTAGQKLGLQIAASVLFITIMRILGYITNVFAIPFTSLEILVPWWAYFAVGTFLIVGFVNAVNLTDGLDGLCTSVTFVVALFFSLLFIQQQNICQIFTLAMCGGLLAFFLFNKYPAKVFMGDTGSLFLGGAVCVAAFAYNMPLVLLPVGIIYVLEALSDIIQVVYFKLTGGKRIFKMAPIHHHFELCGMSEVRITAIFTLITLVMCAITYFALIR